MAVGVRVGVGVLVGVTVEVDIGNGVSVKVGGGGVGLGGGVHESIPIDSASRSSHVVALIMVAGNLGYVRFVSRGGTMRNLYRTTSL